MADNEQIPQEMNALQQEAAALDAAITRAASELNALSASADEADQLAAQAGFDNCTVHEVPGIGRYAVPLMSGWEALIDIIHDKTVDINFSATEYPLFDSIILERTESGYLDDPDEPKYDSATYRHLRDNIAAVRNFLMQTYYADTPHGMTDTEARQALREIATFVGDGLYNNLRLFGVIPNHNISKPFIALDQASAPHGKGAQYIYEQILKRQRKSSWMRPFEEILAFFGGSKPVDWMLPSAMATPFLNLWAEDANASRTAEAEALARLQNLEAERGAVQQVIDGELVAINAQEHTASDLESIGSDLLEIAEQPDLATQLSEGERSRAVAIARDILDKLRIVLGGRNVKDGLQISSREEIGAFGGLEGVGRVFERLLAWGSSIDPSIMQHPSIMGAIQAVGQFGYYAQLQALQMAKSLGDGILADRIAARIAAMPSVYKQANVANFGELLNRIESGIDTVLGRVQIVQGPGAAVGHTPYKDIGFMNATPTAGQANQITTDGTNRDAVGKRNMEILAAEAANAEATARQIQSRQAARTQQGQTAPAVPTRPARGQQAAVQAQAQARRSSTSTTTPAVTANQANMSAQQRAFIARQNALRGIHDHDEHDHHHPHGHAPGSVNPNMINPQLMRQLRTSGIAGAPGASGKPGYGTVTPGTPIKPPATPSVTPPQQVKASSKPLTDEEKKRKQNPDIIQPPPTGPNRGGGRGV